MNKIYIIHGLFDKTDLESMHNFCASTDVLDIYKYLLDHLTQFGTANAWLNISNIQVWENGEVFTGQSLTLKEEFRAFVERNNAFMLNALNL